MDNRAVSESIGFALTFSLVAATVAIVSISGFATLQDARNAEQMNNAERAFDVLDENMADIYTQGAPSRATEISLERAQLLSGDAVFINVSLDPTNAASSPSFEGNYRYRPLVYRSKADDRIVYSAGSIFRLPKEGGGVVIKEAPFVFNETTGTIITVPRTTTDGAQTIGGSTILVRANNEGREVDASDQFGTYSDIWVNVSTTERRADLWEEQLDDKDLTDCFQPEDGRVACHITTAPQRVYVSEVEIAVAFDR